MSAIKLIESVACPRCGALAEHGCVGARIPHFERFSAARAGLIKNEMAAGAVAGFQAPLGADPDRLKETIRALVREIIRKKPGGGGYRLYPPNKGKKRKPKSVGEFPTRLAAKRAELARFPPKDPEQLKRARARLDKIMRDPKKRADAERRDLTGQKAPKTSGSPKKAPKAAAKRESLIAAMSRAIHESLFREADVPGSPWDERLASLHPDVLSGDKKLHAHHRNIERASIGALGDGHKMMAKALRGIAKVHPGEIGHDPERRKRFMPITLDVGGEKVGPVHLYVDGGHVRIELSDDARGQIAQLEPPQARQLRGGLMSLEEDGLPKIDGARRAWEDRDAYLDKMHGKLDGALAKMTPVELHLARQLMNTKHRSRR